MVSAISEAVFDVYQSVLSKQPKPFEIKGIISGLVESFGSEDLLTDSDEIRAYHVAIAIYSFYVEGDVGSWKVLPQLISLLDDRTGKIRNISLDDLCFFDKNLDEKPKSFQARKFREKGNKCLIQGGFFYRHQQNLRSHIGESQIRWTGKSAFERAAELSGNYETQDICQELSGNYEGYEKGFRRIRDMFYSNAN